MPYIAKDSKDSVTLSVYVQPRASKNRVVGLHDGSLKLAVTAPPADGKANKHVLELLAAVLGVPKRELSITSGAHSRKKKVLVKKLRAERIRTTLQQYL